MKLPRLVVALLLIPAVLVYAQGNTFKVRYNGGTLQTKVDPKDWDNKLNVTSDTVTLNLKDRQTLQIPTSSVTSLSYGQEAHRRVGTMIALGILVAPLALFGLMHKTRLHFVGIEYTQQDGRKGGLLLQGHKENYRALLMALKSATGAPLAVSPEDRKYVPTSIEASVVRPGTEEKPGTAAVRQPTNQPTRAPEPSPTTATPAAPTRSAEIGIIAINSNPDGAELFVDSRYAGNAPASIKLTPGTHSIQVVMKGYKDWARDISITAGSDLKVNAVLERQ